MALSLGDELLVMHVDERYRLRLSASLIVPPPLAPFFKELRERGKRNKPGGLAAYLVPESLVLGSSIVSCWVSCATGYELFAYHGLRLAMRHR